jgi:ATP-binding cassette subfamily F protein 3
VRLMKLILSAPNVLILDEPTNHLDIPSREALEQALEEFPGTIIAVSHDRYFLDRIVKRLLVLRAGSHVEYRGNYSDYIRELEAEAAGAEHTGTGERHSARRSRSPTVGKRSEVRERSRFDRMSLDELEKCIIGLEERITHLEAAFADPNVYRDRTKVVGLRAECEALRQELAGAEASWNRRAEQGQP